MATLEALGHHVTPCGPLVDLAEAGPAVRDLVGHALRRRVVARLAELGRPLADDDLEAVTRMRYEAAAGLDGDAERAAPRRSRRPLRWANGGWRGSIWWWAP